MCSHQNAEAIALAVAALCAAMQAEAADATLSAASAAPAAMRTLDAVQVTAVREETGSTLGLAVPNNTGSRLGLTSRETPPVSAP
jgi:hypothetical protein